MRDVQGPAVRLQSGHLVPGGHPDRAGAGGATQPRDEPHEGAAKDSQGGAAHPDAALPLVRLSTSLTLSERTQYTHVTGRAFDRLLP